MSEDEINAKIDTRWEEKTSKRIESAIQTLNAIVIEAIAKLEARMFESVGIAVDTKINGKLIGIKGQVGDSLKQNEDILLAITEMKNSIDGVKTEINKIATDTKPLVRGKNWLWDLFVLLTWIAAAITGLGGAFLIFKKIFFDA